MRARFAFKRDFLVLLGANMRARFAFKRDFLVVLTFLGVRISA
jgi:hypothetical protein